MKIIVCCKIVQDEEQIGVLGDRTLDLSETPWKISQYDLNALDSGKKLARETGGTVTALSAGGTSALNPSKIRKDVLSRGADDLKLVIDDSRTFSDSLETAKALAGALKEIGDFDVVLCGMGSGDLYSQEVGIQTGALLGLPAVNNVTDITPAGDGLIRVERTLENEVEILEVALPAVISVSSEINVPSVPTMRDIMKAGKKPVEVLGTADGADASLTTLTELAPEQQERRGYIIEGDGDEAIDELVRFLKKECL